MMSRKFFWTIILMAAALTEICAQKRDTLKAFEAELFAQARYRSDSIVLRWAPTKASAWTQARTTGFIIARTMLDEGGSFDPATFQVITPAPIKPWPLERWASIAGQNSTDDFAKVAAQALYGKSFTATGFIAQADEYATRFSFAMLAADISKNAAQALGVRYADKKIEKGKTYVYKITCPTDTSKYKIIPGVAIVNTLEEDQIAPVVIANTVERERMIEIHWNRNFHAPHFSAYYIERSDDNGKNYKRLNKMPFIHPISEKNPRTVDNIVYSDSIPVNYKEYYYRVVGITPFGELAKPSEAVKALGRDRTPPPPPVNVQAKHAGGKKVRITWDYPKQTKAMRGFLIGRGNNPSKQFTPLTAQPLPFKTREYVDMQADESGSNYYIVAAVDTSGNASISLAQYAMIIDSIPPSPPNGLAGAIDSLGHVTLRWKLGSERDIKGYLVFFANKPDHEFSQLTHRPLQDTVFRDTIAIKTLTKKIYYRVVAIDYNSNYSKFSEILELRRPDVVPPSAAVMDSYKVTEQGVELVWVASSSEDLAKTILYRLDDKKKDWTPIATFPANGSKMSFTDTTNLEAGKIYSYSLISIDEDGLQSKRSIPIKLKYADFSKRQAVNNLFVQPNVKDKNIFVNWTYPVKGEYRFIVYRAVNGSGFTSYNTLSGNITSFKDVDVRKGSTYEYSVGVVYKDGKKAPFGKIVKTSL
ncbi:MAG: hypothetical protein ACOYXT_06115 [Bacteroidota bacterium]